MTQTVRRRVGSLVTSFVIALWTTGCVHEKPASPPPSPAAVTVAKAAVKSVPVQLNAIGTVRVFATVAVRPRVTGELTAVHFNEGEYVKAGQDLFTVDPRPYQTALIQAKAIVERDLATLGGTELILKRSESRPSALTAEEMDRLRAEVGIARASLAADRAAQHTAELQLEFTTIKAPIEGRTGNLLIPPGNLVTANELTPLVVINQISPISVSFAVAEKHLANIEESLSKNGGTLPVEVSLRGGSSSITGELTFIDNAVDSTTGMVQLKAKFLNADRRLWPGQFVDVVLTLSQRPNSVTIPSAAVQDGQNGSYVYVVRKDSTAEMRPIEVAFTINGEAVVTKGLTGDETVVTDGHLRIAPDAKVAVRGSETQQ